jgi:outer membrane protein assembly factor BamB
MERTRRRVLAACGTLLATLAGCGRKPDDAPSVTRGRFETTTAPGGAETDVRRSVQDGTESPTDTPTDTATPTATPEPGSHARWRRETETPLASPPVVLGGSVYVQGDQLFALAARDGTDQWRYGTDAPLPDEARQARPLVGSSNVYATRATDGGTLTVDAVGRTTGQRQWRVTPANVTGQPVLLGASIGTVYVGTRDDDRGGGAESDNRTYAIDTSGTSRWDRTVGDVVGGRDAAVVESDRVLLSTADVLWALDASDGTALWSAEQSGRRLAVVDRLVVADDDGRLQVRTVGDGTVRWRRTGDAFRADHWRVAGQFVVGGQGGRAFALDVESGDTRWETSIPGSRLVGLARVDATLYALPGGTDARVVAISTASGSVQWTSDPLGPGDPAGVDADGQVYVRTTDPAAVVALDAGTGRIRWRRPFDRQLLDPVVVDDTAYVATTDGSVYALA